jgi:UDP-N-acetylmuramoyl-tripeptide--D-alanyl-D-alanine ligase
MINGRLSEVAFQLRGDLAGRDDGFNGVSTDTRTLEAGQLFVALKGPDFDGNRFVAEARNRGAAGAVVSDVHDCDLPQIRVPDTLLALGELAAHWRSQFDTQVVAVTGSSGKTTVKEMLASILCRHAPTLATRGNLNNEIGVPLTLFHLGSEHRMAVIEMGANHAGEIERLCQMARPHVGVVTMAGASHLEGFGSLEGVAHAKGELFQALDEHGTAVINADDSFAALWQDISGAGRVILFGHGPGAEVTARQIEGDQDRSRFELVIASRTVAVELPLPGRHNVTNALAAAACAFAVGVDLEDIAAGLADTPAVGGRLEVLNGPGGCRLINDTYNANPGSVRAALDYVTSLEGSAWAVLGDMGELGQRKVDLHGEIGGYARSIGVERLFAIGDLSRETVARFGAGGEHYADLESLRDGLAGALCPGVNLLVKASRMMRLERLVEALEARPAVESACGES